MILSEELEEDDYLSGLSQVGTFLFVTPSPSDTCVYWIKENSDVTDCQLVF